MYLFLQLFIGLAEKVSRVVYLFLQLFIGHAEKVSRVMFTPDNLSFISCGEAIFVWDFLAHRRAEPPKLE